MKKLNETKKNQKMAGARIIIETLKKENVDTIFTYPGAAIIGILDELYNTPKINSVLVRHEQAAVHAADGYARSSGKPGIVLVTSGPGATNTVTGLYVANHYNSPVICMTGQVNTDMIGIDTFQEADMTGLTNSCTKHNYLVKDINDLTDIMKSSFHIVQTGKPGPVLIDIPKNITYDKAYFNYEKKLNIRGYSSKVGTGVKKRHNNKTILINDNGIIDINADNINEIKDFVIKYGDGGQNIQTEPAGFALSAAMGAQFANKDKTVISIMNSYSFQMNMQELATIRINGLPLKIIIINNSKEKCPDIIKLAQAYHIKAGRTNIKNIDKMLLPFLENKKSAKILEIFY